MSKHIPDGLFSITVPASVPTNPLKVKEREKLMTHLRRQSKKGDTRRGDMHRLIKSKGKGLDFHAICYARGERVDIERVGVSIPMETKDTVTMFRTAAISLETAPLSDQALEVAAAESCLKRTGYDPAGLIFPLIETGIASRDKAAAQIEKRARERGYTVDDIAPQLLGELEHLVNENFRITDSWYYNLHTVFIPPEHILELAKEQERIDTWLRDIEAMKRADPTLTAKIAASIDKFTDNLRERGLYGQLRHVATSFRRRIESISIGTDGVVSMTINTAENDNDSPADSVAS